MSKNKKIILAAVAFVVVVAVFITVYFVTRPKGEEGEKSITITVIREGADDQVTKLNTDAEFLAEALDEAGIVKSEDIADGMFSTVGDYTADKAKEEWWGFYVNGVMANYGILEIPVKNGEKYELVLEVGYDFG